MTIWKNSCSCGVVVKMRYELKIPNTFSENDSVVYILDSILETSLLHKVQTYILIVDMSCLFPHLKLMCLLLHLHTHIRAFEDCHIPKRLPTGWLFKIYSVQLFYWSKKWTNTC